MRTRSTPLVTVIIPTYNAEKYLRQALRSVRRQTYRSIETIVVDDGSTDSTVQIVRQFDGVTLLMQPHGGASRARNRGLQAACGEFVKFLDSDDILCRDCISEQVEATLEAGEYSIVYSDAVVFNQEKRSRRRVATELDRSQAQDLELLRKNIPTPCPLYPRRALAEAGGFDESFLRAQEYNLHLRLSLQGYSFVRLAGAQCIIREHRSPHRISNRAQSAEMKTNRALRFRRTVDTIRSRYGAAIPDDISAYLVCGICERAAASIRHGDLREASRSCSDMIYLRPAIRPLAKGARSAFASLSKKYSTRIWRRLKTY